MLELDREIILYSSDISDIRFLDTISKEFGLKHITPNNLEWKDAMKILSNASLSISGRYHPTIMSLCGHTPCYFISANNCKMEGTHELFYSNGENFSNSHKFGEDADKIYNWAQKTLDTYELQTKTVKDKLSDCRTKS